MKFNIFSICTIAAIFMISHHVNSEDRVISPQQMVKGRFFEINNILISDARYLVLSKDKQEQAKKMLSSKSFVELNMDEFLLLTGKSNFRSDEMLRLEIEKAEKYSAYAERMSGKFPDARRYKNAMDAHQNYIAYMRTIKCPLTPYLVTAKLYSPYTGQYSIFLRGDRLDVTHLSLGKDSAVLTDEYLIVFLEKRIKEVNVKASVAS